MITQLKLRGMPMEILITHKGLVKPDEAKKVLESYGFKMDTLLSCECWTADDKRCAQDDKNIGYVVINIETSMTSDELVALSKKANKKTLLIESICDRSYNSIYDADD